VPTLTELDAKIADEVEARGVFDTFGDDRRAGQAAQADECLDHRVHGGVCDIGERAVQLYQLRLQGDDVAQRCVSGAEVVHGEAHA
jgi:hypothetical protein